MDKNLEAGSGFLDSAKDLVTSDSITDMGVVVLILILIFILIVSWIIFSSHAKNATSNSVTHTNSHNTVASGTNASINSGNSTNNHYYGLSPIWVIIILVVLLVGGGIVGFLIYNKSKSDNPLLEVPSTVKENTDDTSPKRVFGKVMLHGTTNGISDVKLTIRSEDILPVKSEPNGGYHFNDLEKIKNSVVYIIPEKNGYKLPGGESSVQANVGMRRDIFLEMNGN